jgi:hypothetical protein
MGLFISLAAMSLGAQAKEATEAKVVAASMFKNGFVVITREIPLDSKNVGLIVDPPRAALGTIWFTTTTNKIKSVSTFNETVKNSYKVTASDFASFLRLNIGKVADITTTNLGVIKAKVVEVAGSNVTLEAEDKSVSMISLSEIRRVSFGAGATLSKTEEGAVERRVLRVETDSPGKLYMVSLEQGMSWAPGYAIDISKPDKLSITGKATVVNDLVDMKDVDARFVAGFPNLPYANIFDPLTSGESLTSFVRSIGGPPGAGGGGMASQGRAMEMMKNAAPAISADDIAGSFATPELGGEQNDELFFYRSENLTLPRGGRSYQVLFNAQAPYEKIFRWDSVDGMNSIYGPSGETAGFDGTWMKDANDSWNWEGDDVWQTIKFTNTAGQPFSTAVATIFRNGQVVGQDMMRYTSPGGPATVRVTKAMDVQTTSDIKQTERKQKTVRISENQTWVFDQVVYRTTLTLQNRKKDPIKVRVRRGVTGMVVAVEDGGKVVRDIPGANQWVANAVLEWTVSIPAGGKTTLSYSVRRNEPIR